MTTPSSEFHSKLLLLPIILLVLISAAADHMILAAATERQQPMIARPGCQDKCGNISIPFPFGIGPKRCFSESFEVICDDSASPSRAFLADKRAIQSVSEASTSSLVLHPETMPLDNSSRLQLEIINISAATSEARVYGGVSYLCSTNETDGLFKFHLIALQNTPFAVSATRNVLVGVGWRAEPYVTITGGKDWADDEFFCRSDFLQEIFIEHATNGSCNGQGCCENTFPPAFRSVTYVDMRLFVEVGDNIFWHSLPCSYGMLVEKSWYNFSTPDMYHDKVLAKRFPRGVPLALDFAIGNASCPAAGQQPPSDYACVSGNSSCANVTIGYVCKCWENYEGNPYITDGCLDIDECKNPQLYPCSSDGICKNKPGGYDCPCKSGMKGDGKAGTCTNIFSLAAKVTVGAIGSILLMAVLSFLIVLRQEKRKMGEFYRKNGGPTLEKAHIIKLFKKEELKPILKSNNLIGKGGFGEVYKGLLGNNLVAVKKPINGNVLENEQFANEVIVQSQVIHRNIVRLIGCCLEVDTPMLVYEFISQGSLHDILHDKNRKVALNLAARLSIAAQSADGLAYMHSKTNTMILHGDVKPANILLDDNFVPKISDFGISRLIARDKEHTGSVIGDMNYMDPIYLQKGLLTQKSDVYSFGVVILELISRRKATHSEANSLVNNFLEAHENKNRATELFDKEIAVPEDLELLDILAEIAMECLSLDVDQRPTMTEVAERLLELSRSRKV